jgi:hypothetical protein
MRWTKKDYQEGDVRTVKRFAWLPVEISNTDIVVWWESYYAVERLMLTGHDGEFEFATLEWTVIDTQCIGEE